MAEMKRCPYCGKEILAVAKKCRYCGMWLNEEKHETKKMITCPVCGEQIEEGTDVCPCCKENISGVPRHVESAKEENTIRHGHEEENGQDLRNGNNEDIDEDINEDDEPEGVLMYYYIDVFFKHYIDFSGKLSRKRYWMAILLNAIFSLVLFTIDTSLLKTTVPVLSNIYTLGTIVPLIASGVRRLHDAGRSGWWYCVSFIPVVGQIGLIALLCFPGRQVTRKPENTTLDKIVFGLIVLSMIIFHSAYVHSYMNIYNLIGGQENKEIILEDDDEEDEDTAMADTLSSGSTDFSDKEETPEVKQQIAIVKDFYTEYLKCVSESNSSGSYDAVKYELKMLFNEYVSHELLEKGDSWRRFNEEYSTSWVDEQPYIEDYFRRGCQSAGVHRSAADFSECELIDVKPFGINTYQILYIDSGERAKVFVRLALEDGKYKIAEAFS